jgi:hypothetical protein
MKLGLAVGQVLQEHKECLQYVVQVRIYFKEEKTSTRLYSKDIAECNDVIEDQTIPKDTRLLVASKETLQIYDTGKILFELFDPRAMGIVVVSHRVPNIVVIGQAVAFHYKKPWLLAVGHDHCVDLSESVWQLVCLHAQGETMTEHGCDSVIVFGKELAIQEGKPADMAAKISEGRLNKFFQENTLLSQPFVRDNKVNVEQFLASAEKGLTVSEFLRFSTK